jgi:hypothetical protein
MSAAFEAAERLEEDRATKQVDVVGDVQVAVVVGEHQVGLGDHAHDAALVVHHGQARQLVTAERRHHFLDRRVRPHRGGLGVHDVAHDCGHSGA